MKIERNHGDRSSLPLSRSLPLFREFRKSRSSSAQFPGISECVLSFPVDTCLPLLPSWLRRWASRGEHTLERKARSRSKEPPLSGRSYPAGMLINLTGSAKLLLAIDIPLFASPLFICPSVCRLIYLATSPERSISAVVLIRMLAGNLARSIKLAHNASQP